MKRVGNMIFDIADTNNLLLAFHKSSRGKRTKKEVIRFRNNLDENIDDLRKELSSGLVQWGLYHSFRVQDPKPRLIHAAPFRSRVAQLAIMNVCDPYFESYQINDSYACRKGKGLDRAIYKTLNCLNSGGWYLKMDVRKYFDSIDQPILMDLLSRRFKDEKLLNVFRSLLDTYESVPGKGIPIGNLTSQYFANHYLAVFDHYIKEDLRVRRYLRYMDDFVLWSKDKEYLLDIRKKIEEFLWERLQLTVKPANLNRCDKGMTFLGYRLYPHGIRLSRRSRDRFRRKMLRYTALFRAGAWSENEFVRHVEPLTSFVKRAQTRSYRERIIKECGLCPEARTA